MSDVQPKVARSTAFVDNWNGSGVYVFSLEDGSCLKVAVTLTQAALHLEDISRAIGNQIRKQENKK